MEKAAVSERSRFRLYGLKYAFGIFLGIIKLDYPWVYHKLFGGEGMFRKLKLDVVLLLTKWDLPRIEPQSMAYKPFVPTSRPTGPGS